MTDEPVAIRFCDSRDGQDALGPIGDVIIAARPVTRRIAFATAADLPLIQPDDVHLAAILERRGIEPVSCIWNDPAVDWSGFQAVLIRTIWDYYKHPAAFGQWLDRLDRLGVPTINVSRVLRWNSDKRYLFDLADHGVAIIPTRLTAATDLPDVLASMPGQSVVVKPSVSGSAWHTVRGTAGDATFALAVARLPRELDYLVQPFIPEIASDGEWSLLYFAGAFSHAVIKRPAAGDYRVQVEHGGSTTAADPDSATLAAAEHTLASVVALGYDAPTYARVDGVICADRFVLMELELIEPFLFLAGHPACAERLAEAVARRVTARGGHST